jgi:hypothetical protein
VIESRLINIAVQMALLALTQWWFFRSLRERSHGAAKLPCPLCQYDLKSCPSRVCPECGWSISGDRLVECFRLDFIGRTVFLIGLQAVVVANFCFWIGRAALEIYRVLKVGSSAFMPGFSLFDNTMDGVDVAILLGSVGVGAAWVGVSTVVMYRRLRARHDTRVARAIELEADLHGRDLL